MSDRAPLLAIVGPTASGKTGLAVELCRRLDGEIVGCDASQIYRGLDIGTGKITPAELGRVRHHLIDIVEPEARFDAAAYVAAADAAIADVRARGRRPILCGGTGLYLRALIRGLCAAPPVAPPVRDAIHRAIEAGELPALHAELARVDPTAAARIPPADRQRIERALGVYRTSGRPLSAWQAEHAAAPDRVAVRPAAIRWPRDELWARIERRVDHMLADGWLDEVRGLVAAGHRAALARLKALGYRHLLSVLDGEATLTDARARIVVETRRYARRQRTWFRKTPGLRWFDGPPDVDAVQAWLTAGDRSSTAVG